MLRIGSNDAFVGLRLVLDVHDTNSNEQTVFFVDLEFISIKSPVQSLEY
jgi:hypothetical protein